MTLEEFLNYYHESMKVRKKKETLKLLWKSEKGGKGCVNKRFV